MRASVIRNPQWDNDDRGSRHRGRSNQTRYGIRTPGSSGGNPFVSLVTSSIAWTCADAQTIASGSLSRCSPGNVTVRSATF
jgi:hypothetical protein